MKKWLLILIIGLAIIPLSFADQNVTCQWSPDNITNWRNITHLEINLSEGLQTGLTSNTRQFFRCKNDTSEFNYRTVTTKRITDLFEGENLATLIFWFGLAAAMFTLILAIITQDHWVASFSAFLWIVMGFFMFVNGFGDLNNLVTTTIAIVFWGFGSYIFFKAQLESI